MSSSLVVCDQALSLDSNQLTFIYTKAFHGIGGLLSLKLHNNNISFLERGVFSELSQLKTLLLQNNKLPRIQRGTFDRLASLMYIDLSRNRLTYDTLPRDGFFRRATKLRRIHLDDNQLTAIDSCIMAASMPPHATAARTLSLLGNPINCDCSLRWILRLRYIRNYGAAFTLMSFNAQKYKCMALLPKSRRFLVSQLDSCGFSIGSINRWSLSIHTCILDI